MSRHRLRINYRRSGGFAGLDLAAETFADDLPHEQAGLAAQLLAQPPTVRARSGAPPGVADQFTYELHLDDGTRQQSLRWSESEVPDDVRPLLSALNSRATPARPR